ncbi:MAG: DUF2817 domain-containing protein [Bdellovibrionota bacterium]|nr:murein peptide amidase A [Pseudobdellovibrionaceae bacterium]|tara:strand:- start:126891 stop:127583 length:693 start_codon:yes stop_codon:yes gene_type:complete
MNDKIHTIKQWTRSAGKLDISLHSSFKITGTAHKNPILFIGGVHGDEPEGVKMADELLNYLKESPSFSTDWVLIPCLNPDGFKKNQRVNANAVDLNRNFPSICWSSDYEKDRYFPGNSPASEPEIKALVDLIDKIKPQLIIHFHSWEPCIVYSNEKARLAAELFSSMCDYPIKSDIGYPTPGSLGEYAGNDLNLGVICIEEKEGEALENVFPKFKPAFEILLEGELDENS